MRVSSQELTAGRIFVNDVAMRDGLQAEPIFVPTDDKVGLANALMRTGIDKLEVTSFTSASAIPALRDAEEVMGRIDRVPGVRTVALVLNLRGAERALECRVDELNLVISASETHSLANVRATRAQTQRALHEVIRRVNGSTALNVSIATAFGCPMEGAVAVDEVLRLGDDFVERGVGGITLCDTTGMAHPGSVRALCEGLAERWPGVELTLHLHDTRGMGLANALAGIDSGVRRFDASLGGLGGCPYAPGATGNVCTEDLVHMLEAMGHDTGVDLGRLVACASRLRELVGHEVPSRVLAAGPWDRRHPPPGDLEAIRARALAREADR